MKLKYVIIGLIIVLIGGCCFLIFFNKNKIKDDELNSENIKSFYLGYTNGYMMNADIRYSLIINDNKYIAKIKPYLVDEEDTLEIEVEKDVLDKITNILKKYQVNKWDGFDKVDHDVLDGNSFSLSIRLNDGKTIEASGYMEWPDNYGNVKNEISDIFMEIYNKEKGISEDE